MTDDVSLTPETRWPFLYSPDGRAEVDGANEFVAGYHRYRNGVSSVLIPSCRCGHRSHIWPSSDLYGTSLGPIFRTGTCSIRMHQAPPGFQGAHHVGHQRLLQNLME